MASSTGSSVRENKPSRVSAGEKPRTNTRNGVTLQPGVTSLVAALPPQADFQDLPPDQVEFYVRAAIHQDRTPGNLLVVRHPGRGYKFPDLVPKALSEAGFNVKLVDTEADRVASVHKIRDALVELSTDRAPLDILGVSGDGTLDNHVLVAAYWAFFPDLVQYKPGAIDCGRISTKDLKAIPDPYRFAFFRTLPDVTSLEPTEETIKQVWLLRTRLAPMLRKRKKVSTILRKTGRQADDPLLRVSILATLFPDRVVLRSHGFDLSGLANASRDRTFQGLYPHIRCICLYPAGTAADNAVFAGSPGWGYGLFAGILTRFSFLSRIRKRLELRLTRAFLSFFLHGSVVVPERVSIIGIDGEWQRISSHVVGGPAAGHFFSSDLAGKTKGLTGYLKRIPKVLIKEAILGATIVRVRSRFASGEEKSFAEARIGEAMYTNRTFIAGVASVPTTNPTSFAGQSSLLMVPPIWSRSKHGHRILNFRGLLTVIESITKGVLARTLHMLGLGVGTLAGGGRLNFLLPEHQVAIKDGESIEIDYLTREGKPCAIAIQASGEPLQAYRMNIRIAWGPVPILGSLRSQLLAATRRSLADLRVQQTYRMGRVYIGGLRYFRHRMGEDWSPAFSARTGLLVPPHHLPRSLPRAQRMLLDAWQAKGTGEFVDTTESGLSQLRRGRYAHNNDQSAYLLLLRESKGILLVRQVRAKGTDGGEIYETRSSYRAMGASYIVFRNQTLLWKAGEYPKILQEDYLFRSAEAFQQLAPSFFPVVASFPQEATLMASDPGEDKPELRDN